MTVIRVYVLMGNIPVIGSVHFPKFSHGRNCSVCLILIAGSQETSKHVCIEMSTVCIIYLLTVLNSIPMIFWYSCTLYFAVSCRQKCEGIPNFRSLWQKPLLLCLQTIVLRAIA